MKNGIYSFAESRCGACGKQFLFLDKNIPRGTSTCGVRVSQRDGSVKGESPTSLQMLLFCLEYLQNERVAAIIPNKACKVKQTNGIWKDPLGVNKCHS